MKVVLQRVLQASVKVNNQIIGEIGQGLLVLVGIISDDNIDSINWICNKIINLRIFGDDEGKMNRSVKDINGEILVVSNFTLYGDARKGNRPNFSGAAKPEMAIPIYNSMVDEFKKSGLKIETGIFGAMMDVSLINDGPVTLIIEK